MNTEQTQNQAKALFRDPVHLPPTAWWGHIPFLFSLFETTQPKVFVELGVHFGASFLAASEATKLAKSATRIVGVDTWEGDAHAGFYSGDEIYAELKWRLAANDVPFELMRCTFDDAAKQFLNNSIDILHIDGLHTYEAVKQDFNTWLPKMKSNGIVILHDVNEFRDDFGVYKLYEELAEKYRAFKFLHSHGLGVICLDKSDERLSIFEDLLIDPKYAPFFQTVIENLAHAMVRRVNLDGRGFSLVEQELNSIKNSTSWKITSPLRWLKQKIVK
jgi:predicted O-methyltransferase YrrM